MSGGAPRDVVALEAVRLVAREYGVPTGQLKPCVAFLLDGNLGGAARHNAAFTIAIELRRLGLEEPRVAEALSRWSRKVGYRPSDAKRALRSAFEKTPDGKWRYFPPGLHKRSRVYAETLKPTCDAIGCPANCPAMAGKFAGPVKETFERFSDLGWPGYLKKHRWRSAVDVYEGICRREKQLGLVPGVELFTTYEQLAGLGEVHKTTVGKALRRLAALGLITFDPGSGSGPHSRDRVASRVGRVVPIPTPPGSPIRAIEEGGGRPPSIGRRNLRAQPRHFESWGGPTAAEHESAAAEGPR